MQKIHQVNHNIIVTTTAMKNLSMFCKINEPFKAIQFVVTKGVKKEEIDSLQTCIDESGSKKIFICREYDGSERYLLIYPTGLSVDYFPQLKSVIFLS